MTTKYFKEATDLYTLKKEYRKLIKENHPDNGGDTWVMAAINNETVIFMFLLFVSFKLKRPKIGH